MARIDYYFSVTSPWCHLATERLAGIAARHGASVVLRPLDMLQLLDRTGGTRPEARRPGRIAQEERELARWADHLGVPLARHPRQGAVSGAPASYALIAAQSAGQGTGQGDSLALLRGILHACWVDGRDIADDGVLRALLGECGFDPGLVDSGLFTGAEAFGRNLEDAVAAGIFEVPFAVVAEGGEGFRGLCGLDFLDRYLAAL